MTTLNTGAPHFKSVMKQHRHANYTLSKVLNEFIDNVIKKTNDIRVYTQIDDSEKLQEVKVSDNYVNGFENLDNDGVNNPFNMGHIKISHDDDSETSEFGVGMKAGALAAANQLNVYTRIADSNGQIKYIEVNCDFIRMASETDVNASYNPRIKLITYDEYREQHPFEYGSTLKLTKIRDCIYSKTTHSDITTDISNCIADTYSRFISRGINIYVNDTLVQNKYDFFDDHKCEPFTICKELFILEKPGTTIYIIRKTKEQTVWQEFNKESGEWIKLRETSDGIQYMKNLITSGYKYRYTPFTPDGVCMFINSTFTFYSDKFHTGNKATEPALPEDCVYIFKDDRNYGKQSLLKHNNGSHNYTLHELDFVAKRLGKDIGITFNKEILMTGNNDLIVAIKSALSDSRIEFSSDTGTKKNESLCEKAIKKGLIDLMTCPEAKLSGTHRDLKMQSSYNSAISAFTVKSSKSKPTTNTVTTIVQKKTNTKISSKKDSIKQPEQSKIEEQQSKIEEQQSNQVEEQQSKQVEEQQSNQVEEQQSKQVEESKKDTKEEDKVKQDTNQEEQSKQLEEAKHDTNVDISSKQSENNEERNHDYEKRKARIISIVDHLNKTILESNEDVLSNDILKSIEELLNITV